MIYDYIFGIKAAETDPDPFKKFAQDELGLFWKGSNFNELKNRATLFVDYLVNSAIENKESWDKLNDNQKRHFKYAICYLVDFFIDKGYYQSGSVSHSYAGVSESVQNLYVNGKLPQIVLYQLEQTKLFNLTYFKIKLGLDVSKTDVSDPVVRHNEFYNREDKIWKQFLEQSVHSNSDDKTFFGVSMHTWRERFLSQLSLEASKGDPGDQGPQGEKGDDTGINDVKFTIDTSPEDDVKIYTLDWHVANNNFNSKIVDRTLRIGALDITNFFAKKTEFDNTISQLNERINAKTSSENLKKYELDHQSLPYDDTPITQEVYESLIALESEWVTIRTISQNEGNGIVILPEELIGIEHQISKYRDAMRLIRSDRIYTYADLVEISQSANPPFTLPSESEMFGTNRLLSTVEIDRQFNFIDLILNNTVTKIRSSLEIFGDLYNQLDSRFSEKFETDHFPTLNLFSAGNVSIGTPAKAFIEKIADEKDIFHRDNVLRVLDQKLKFGEPEATEATMPWNQPFTAEQLTILEKYFPRFRTAAPNTLTGDRYFQFIYFSSNGSSVQFYGGLRYGYKSPYFNAKDLASKAILKSLHDKYGPYIYMFRQSDADFDVILNEVLPVIRSAVNEDNLNNFLNGYGTPQNIGSYKNLTKENFYNIFDRPTIVVPDQHQDSKILIHFRGQELRQGVIEYPITQYYGSLYDAEAKPSNYFSQFISEVKHPTVFANVYSHQNEAVRETIDTMPLAMEISNNNNYAMWGDYKLTINYIPFNGWSTGSAYSMISVVPVYETPANHKMSIKEVLELEPERNFGMRRAQDLDMFLVGKPDVYVVDKNMKMMTLPSYTTLAPTRFGDGVPSVNETLRRTTAKVEYDISIQTNVQGFVHTEIVAKNSRRSRVYANAEEYAVFEARTAHVSRVVGFYVFFFNNPGNGWQLQGDHGWPADGCQLVLTKDN